MFIVRRAIGGGEREQVEEAVQLRGPFLMMDVAAGPINILEPDLDGGSIVEENRAAGNLFRLVDDLRRGSSDALTGEICEEPGSVEDGGAAILSQGWRGGQEGEEGTPGGHDW